MGTPLRHIVEGWAAASRGGAIKAVQTGGPSGGCIPAEHLDTRVDYESLAALGSIMGSGGMIVMDKTTNMVEVARFFMEFCMDESCGKCIPCRAGTVQMHQSAEQDLAGNGHAARPATSWRSCATWCSETSLCGLGQTAPNPGAQHAAVFRATSTSTPLHEHDPHGVRPDSVRWMQLPI